MKTFKRKLTALVFSIIALLTLTSGFAHARIEPLLDSPADITKAITECVNGYLALNPNITPEMANHRCAPNFKKSAFSGNSSRSSASTAKCMDVHCKGYKQDKWKQLCQVQFCESEGKKQLASFKNAESCIDKCRPGSQACIAECLGKSPDNSIAFSPRHQSGRETGGRVKSAFLQNLR